MDGPDKRLSDVEFFRQTAKAFGYEKVQHSQWILYSHAPRRVTVDGYVVCPECKSHFMRIEGTWFKRCPECGTKMGNEKGK